MMEERKSNSLYGYLIIPLVIVSLFTCVTRKRVGAECRDGWDSSATGQGACSHHGGVAHWKYEYWWDW